MNKVEFRKPDIAKIRKQGFLCVDMHYHTEYSDTTTKVEDILKKAKEDNIGVAITDHNEIKGAMKAVNNKDVMVIPGIEVTCIEGAHILLYFYNIYELEEFYNKHIKDNKFINPNLATTVKVEDLLEYAKNYNCVVSAAHPFGYKLSYCGLSKCVKNGFVSESVFANIHALEVNCGVMNRVLNKKALKQAEELGKGMTGGSDGHTLFQLGSVVTCSKAGTVEGFLDNIIKGNAFVIGKEIRVVPRIFPYSHVIMTHMKYLGPSVYITAMYSGKRAIHNGRRMIAGSARIIQPVMGQVSRMMPSTIKNVTYEVIKPVSKAGMATVQIFNRSFRKK